MQVSGNLRRETPQEVSSHSDWMNTCDGGGQWLSHQKREGANQCKMKGCSTGYVNMENYNGWEKNMEIELSREQKKAIRAKKAFEHKTKRVREWEVEANRQTQLETEAEL